MKNHPGDPHSTILGAHINYNSSEVPKEKKDTSKNVERILNKSSSEQKDGKSKGKNKLHSINDNIDRSFEDLCVRYNHVPGKLKNVADHINEIKRHSLENLDSSDSSDSESNFSDNTDNPSKGRGMESTEERYCMECSQNLKMQIESPENRDEVLETEVNIRMSKLKEAENLAAKLAEKELAIKELTNDSLTMKKSIVALETENKNLAKRIENSNQQRAHLNKNLRSIHEDYEALGSEKNMVFGRLTGMENAVRELETERHSLKDEISRLRDGNASLKQELEMKETEFKQQLTSIKQNNYAASAENARTLSNAKDPEDPRGTHKNIEHANLEYTSEETENRLTTANANDMREVQNELERLRDEDCTLQQVVSCLQHQKSDSETRLDGKEEVLIPLKELSEVKNEASCEIKTITVCVDIPKLPTDLLKYKKIEPEEKKCAIENVFKVEAPLEKSESKLASKIATQERMLSRQKSRFDRLNASYRLLEEQFQASCLKVEIVKGKINEIEAKEETIRQLEIAVQEHKREKGELQENHQEVSNRLTLSEERRTNAEKEIGRLHETLQAVEVHLHLSNQKFKITKSEYKQKDEDHKRKMKELQQRYNDLEEHCMMLHGDIRYMEDTLRQIKALAEHQSTTLASGFHDLEVVLGESCKNFQSQLTVFFAELQMVKDMLKSTMSNKHELEIEKAELIAKWKKQELAALTAREEAEKLQVDLAEKAQENDRLKMVASDYEEKLAMKAEEEKRLIEVAAKFEKKILELERKLTEKEQEGLVKDDEKREAIRQLCFIIEYHRGKCDHLLQILAGHSCKTKTST